ncbi:alpha/beta hydrolase [Nocardia sp. JMUB6875]|uniref:alpha/beta fold hydrolase n=1 Tax=Nocardia sp. JMUB6875 TaxID=3158170 RepID=UPI0032E7607B
MTPRIPGFDYQRVTVADGVSLNAAVAGSGSPIVLLHGFPQTHLMWRHVAADLAADHTVICPDLRGYGDSDKPFDADGEVYSKRTMGNDIVALAKAFGYDRFALAGHDRGVLVGFRTALDHPDNVTHFLALDVLPTLDMWDVMGGLTGVVGFHLFLMAQPVGLPEHMIGATADEFFGHFLDIWTRNPEAIPAEIRDAYLKASREAIPSIVADYRASAHIDVEHDRVDRAAGSTLRMPVTAMAQDWGAELGFDAEALWRAWAPDLHHELIASGHFMAEEAPAEIIRAMRELLKR